MSQDQNKPQNEKKKGFFARILDQLDKKLEEKSKKTSCCSSDKSKGGSCC